MYKLHFFKLNKKTEKIARRDDVISSMGVGVPAGRCVSHVGASTSVYLIHAHVFCKNMYNMRSPFSNIYVKVILLKIHSAVVP